MYYSQVKKIFWWQIIHFLTLHTSWIFNSVFEPVRNTPIIHRHFEIIDEKSLMNFKIFALSGIFLHNLYFQIKYVANRCHLFIKLFYKLPWRSRITQHSNLIDISVFVKNSKKKNKICIQENVQSMSKVQAKL